MSAKQIEDHVAIARAEPTTANLKELWRAVFLLKAWYFLPGRDDEGPAYPTVSVVDGKPWVLGFTNVRRISEFANAVGRVGADGSVPLLVLDPKESMKHLLEAAKTVEGVIFNMNSEATFRAPVKALEAYAREFGVPLDED